MIKSQTIFSSLSFHSFYSVFLIEQSGPSETNAALEFAVNSVKVSLLFCKFIVKVSMFLGFQGNYYFDELDPSILES